MQVLIINTSMCAQLCLVLCSPMDCSPPWNFPGKNTGVGYHFLLQGNLPHPGMDPVSCISCIGRQILLSLCHLGSPIITMAIITIYK